MNLQEQIRKILREDFEWTEGPINPWIEYDGIVFDIEPTREDVNMYIEQCLNTRKVSNASQWTEDIREKDIDFIIQNSYLGLYQVYTNEINLGYLDDPYYKNGNVILYSKLIGQNIREEMEGLDWIKNTGLGKVDLRTCEPGDLLVSRHGEYLTYVEPLRDENYMDHMVMYSNGAYGSRTHDGYVYRKKRKESDHDIVAILK
jgi:hypothetical protein